MAPSTNIRAVLFDLDGTLRHNIPASTEMFFNFAAQLGVEDSPERRWRAARWTHYYWAQSPELLADIELFKTLTVEFWIYYTQRSLVEFGCSLEQAQRLAPEMHTRMSEGYEPVDFVAEDVPPTLDRLKKIGFKLGIVSNRDKPFQDQLETLKLSEYFDLTVASCEVNAWKPDPAIFHYAVQQIGIPPQQAIYVGDNYYADIVGARRAGLTAVLLDPDQLFPDAGCDTIKKISDVLNLLEN